MTALLALICVLLATTLGVVATLAWVSRRDLRTRMTSIEAEAAKAHLQAEADRALLDKHTTHLREHADKLYAHNKDLEAASHRAGFARYGAKAS